MIRQSTKRDDDGDVDMTDEDIAGRAYASIAAQLESFTSDKVGTLLSSVTEDDGNDDDPSNFYEIDAIEWMKRELQQEDIMPLAPVATPKRTPLLERADTPVMSNSSKKKKKRQQTQQLLPSRRLDSGEDEGEGDGSDSVIDPIQSPFPMMTTTDKYTTATTTTPRGPLWSLSHQYRRYHDALLTYLKARRSLSERLDMEREDEDLVANRTGAMTLVPSTLASQECRVELDLLRSLNHICWNSSSSSSSSEAKHKQEEGNLWMLLLMLRKLGFAALVWDNTGTACSRNNDVQTMYLQDLATQVDKTPRELLQALSASNEQVPLVIQRRYQLIKWMEACLDQVRVEPKTLKKGQTFTSSIAMHPDDDDQYKSSTPSLIGESHPDCELLQSCLSCILAGQSEKAYSLARAYGQPWRAAVWSGGEPHGYDKRPNEQLRTIDRVQVGNTHRFLWKRQTWKNGEVMLKQNRPQEAAISSLLANDVESCLSNPCLRSWEQGLYAILYSTWGNMEDQLLHLHNNHRRQCRPPYPGTNHLRQEQGQLSATSRLIGLSEAQAIQMLSSSPYKEMIGASTYQGAAAAMVEGVNALTDFFHIETHITTKSSESDMALDGVDQEVDGDLVRLRFLTHLSLYLDSLSACTTPFELEGMQEYKNQLLFEYVRHLASRPYLWHMLALYASLLPESTLLEYYPKVLVQVESDHERKAMLEQARDLFPSQGLDLQVLRQVVRLLLSKNDDDSNVDTERSDVQKCRAIQWLVHYDEHMGDALICANMLLRDFFLNQEDDKMEIAMVLVKDYLPEDLLDRAGRLVPTVDDGMNREAYTAKVGNARSEHMAFLSYLEAYQVFGDWKEILSSTTSTTAASAALDVRKLTAAEASIDREMRLRVWLKDKKSKSQIVIDAANRARKALRNVLTHPGGWLWTEEEEFNEKDKEELARQRDIKLIRSRHLVLAVDLYHQVCEETATWMSRSLDDAVIGTRQVSLQILVGEDPTSPPLEKSPYSPDYWYKHALDLAVIVADDKHGVDKAFGSVELQEFLSKLAETAVSKSMDAV